MISRLDPSARRSSGLACGQAALLALASSALILAGCGDKNKDKDKPASQTAAKVNKEEITVHQINFVLQQQRSLAPDQAASAGKQALERLIDQELAVQKGLEQKVDRDPRVVQQLEAARREIIARAYLDRIALGAPKPTAAEVQTYYDAHPALFKERRVYNLQELSIQAKAEQFAELQTKFAASKDVPDFINYLKANDFKFAANQAVRTAEQLPLASLDKFAQMKDGQTIFSATPTGAQLVILAGSRSQPIDEARAVPAIEQFLLNERKRKVVEDDLKALRGSAKIDYVGEYAKGDPGMGLPLSGAASAVTGVASIASATLSASAAGVAPQAEVGLLKSGASASAPTLSTLEKGMKGLK